MPESLKDSVLFTRT
jgi:hypothetical protein